MVKDKWILFVSFAVLAGLFVSVIVFSGWMIWQSSLLGDHIRKQAENQQQEALRRCEPGEETSSRCEPAVPPYLLPGIRMKF